MAELNPHLIERLILELDVPSIDSAPAVQEAAAQSLRAQAMTGIDALFERLAGPNRMVRLEHLEVDLGDLRGGDWQELFASRLVDQLIQLLQQEAARARTEPAAPEAGPAGAFEQFLFFLQHGRLPWWGKIPPQDWPQRVLDTLESRQWQTLHRLLADDAHAQQRLIHTTDDATLAALLDRHGGLPATDQLLALWRPAHLPRTRFPEWRLQFWSAVLSTHAGTEAGARAHGIAPMLRLLEIPNVFSAIEPAGFPPPLQAPPVLPPPWHEWLLAALSHGGPAPTSAVPPAMPRDGNPMSFRQAPTTHPDVDQPADGGSSPQGVSRDPHGHSAESSAAEIESMPQASPPLSSTSTPPPAVASAAVAEAILPEGEAIYANGAGCVILHPFLEELFRSNELLAGRRFRDEAARERAVRLLANVTFGDEATPEYDLLLPKLLCGMAWNEPLTPIELTDAERAACDALLHAVLGHWQALKSNSIEWMRSQFILRAAKLERLDSDWRITVERRAQDVLLDRLPWGLGVVALPWLAGRLYVHWMK